MVKKSWGDIVLHVLNKGQGVMAKKQQIQNNINWMNVLRWGVLVPVLGMVWWFVALGVAFVAGYFFIPINWMFLVLDMLVLPAVAIFLVTRLIAPKYKTLMGWMSVLLCVVWFGFLFYGMLHMAY